VDRGEIDGTLVERLNRFPQGAPPSDVLYRILDAVQRARGGTGFFAADQALHGARAAQCWKTPETEARRCWRIGRPRDLVDIANPDGQSALRPAAAHGRLLRVLPDAHPRDIDQKVLSELFYQYLNVEEDFVKALFTEGETQLGRVFVQEAGAVRRERPARAGLRAGQRGDRDRHQHIGVGMCYCRHKNGAHGPACDAPMDICMTFNGSAESLIRHGHARAVDAAECLDLLEQAYERGLVQFGENVQKSVNFICNCCGCCCEAMIAAARSGSPT
jgi:hypothetical protein